MMETGHLCAKLVGQRSVFQKPISCWNHFSSTCREGLCADQYQKKRFVLNDQLLLSFDCHKVSWEKFDMVNLTFKWQFAKFDTPFRTLH